MEITDNDLKMFQERAKAELTGRGTGSIAWDSVIWDLCHEVRRLRSAAKESGDAAKLREVVGDLLYMAERYLKRTPATESVIFDPETKKEVRTINYYAVVEKARSILSGDDKEPGGKRAAGTADEKSAAFKVGDRVSWTDPTTGKKTDGWTVLDAPEIPAGGPSGDEVYRIENDSGFAEEAYARELSYPEGRPL